MWSFGHLWSVFKISAKFREIRWCRPPPKFENFGNNNLNIFKSIFKNSLKMNFGRNFAKFWWFRPCSNFFDKRNSKLCQQFPIPISCTHVLLSFSIHIYFPLHIHWPHNSHHFFFWKELNWHNYLWKEKKDVYYLKENKWYCCLMVLEWY